jgi:D-serine deaminase-like pyridoxal phosphate-dependent protein
VRLDELETPTATVDLEAVERNINRLQSYCNEHGFACRPHVKTHKLPALAHLQLRAGAVGVTCQKLGEAEVMAAAGIGDILLAFPLVGMAKAERLAALARQVSVSVVGDSATVVRGLGAALAYEGLELDFLVECDTGLGRTGVQSPREAAELAVLVDSLPGLRFAGLMTYPTLPQSGPWLRAAREAIQAEGLAVGRVSGGGTSTYRWTHEIGEVTEIRAGTYVYGDRACIGDGSVPAEQCALRVRATVVSRPTRDRAILDAGTKTLTSDPDESGGGGYGVVVEYPDAALHQLHEEHGFLDVGSCAGGGPEIGEVVTIIPNHACGCTNMHDHVVAHRGGTVVAVWPVAARGKLT